MSLKANCEADLKLLSSDISSLGGFSCSKEARDVVGQLIRRCRDLNNSYNTIFQLSQKALPIDEYQEVNMKILQCSSKLRSIQERQIAEATELEISEHFHHLQGLSVMNPANLELILQHTEPIVQHARKERGDVDSRILVASSMQYTATRHTALLSRLRHFLWFEAIHAAVQQAYPGLVMHNDDRDKLLTELSKLYDTLEIQQKYMTCSDPEIAQFHVALVNRIRQNLKKVTTFAVCCWCSCCPQASLAHLLPHTEYQEITVEEVLAMLPETHTIHLIPASQAVPGPSAPMPFVAEALTEADFQTKL